MYENISASERIVERNGGRLMTTESQQKNAKNEAEAHAALLERLLKTQALPAHSLTPKSLQPTPEAAKSRLTRLKRKRRILRLKSKRRND